MAAYLPCIGIVRLTSSGIDPDGEGTEYRRDCMVPLADGVLTGKYQGQASSEQKVD